MLCYRVCYDFVCCDSTVAFDDTLIAAYDTIFHVMIITCYHSNIKLGKEHSAKQKSKLKLNYVYIIEGTRYKYRKCKKY